jgi:hypothetical protein
MHFTYPIPTANQWPVLTMIIFQNGYLIADVHASVDHSDSVLHPLDAVPEAQYQLVLAFDHPNQPGPFIFTHWAHPSQG